MKRRFTRASVAHIVFGGVRQAFRPRVNLRNAKIFIKKTIFDLQLCFSRLSLIRVTAGKLARRVRSWGRIYGKVRRPAVQRRSFRFAEFSPLNSTAGVAAVSRGPGGRHLCLLLPSPCGYCVPVTVSEEWSREGGISFAAQTSGAGSPRKGRDEYLCWEHAVRDDRG